IRHTSLATAIATLAWIQEEIGPRPGGQADWIVLHPDPQASVAQAPDSRYTVRWKQSPEHDPAFVVYLNDLPETFHTTGRITGPPGSKASSRILLVDAEGKTVRSSEVRSVAGTTDLNTWFDRQTARYVALEVKCARDATPGRVASFDISGLAIEAGKPG